MAAATATAEWRSALVPKGASGWQPRAPARGPQAEMGRGWWGCPCTLASGPGPGRRTKRGGGGGLQQWQPAEPAPELREEVLPRHPAPWPWTALCPACGTMASASRTAFWGRPWVSQSTGGGRGPEAGPGACGRAACEASGLSAKHPWGPDCLGGRPAGRAAKASVPSWLAWMPSFATVLGGWAAMSSMGAPR